MREVIDNREIIKNYRGRNERAPAFSLLIL